MTHDHHNHSRSRLHDAADSIDALEGSERGVHAVKVSFVALMLTALVQVAMVVLTGSVGLLADTIHNFADALTAVPLFVAFRLGRRPSNRRYTYGYHRAEDLAGVFVILMITLSAVIAGWEAIIRLIHPQRVSHLGGPVRRRRRRLRRQRARRLVPHPRRQRDRLRRARGRRLPRPHRRVHLPGCRARRRRRVGGLRASRRRRRSRHLDRDLRRAAGAARQIYYRLMDAVDPSIVDRIETAVATSPGVLAVAPPRVRWVGHRLVTDLDITVPASLPVREAHAIAENVRHTLLHRVPHLDDAHVHVDPDDAHAHERASHHG